MRQVNEAGVNLVKEYEGLVDGDPNTPGLDPYICPAGYWTIGWGHVVLHPETGDMLREQRDARGRWTKTNEAIARAIYPNGITIDEAEALLEEDLTWFGERVARYVTVPLTDNQFAALVSFAFNVGIGLPRGHPQAPNGRGLRGSTLLRRLNEGDYGAPLDELPKWNKGGGAVLSGLIRRREAEMVLWATPDV